MNNTFYKGYYEDHYLAHHGILGMHWGKRNGPPYPLTASGHSVSEKKAGWRKSLGGGRNEKLYNRKEVKKQKIANKYDKKIGAVQKDIDSFSSIKNGYKTKNGKVLLTKNDVKESVKGLEYTKSKLENKKDQKLKKVDAGGPIERVHKFYDNLTPSQKKALEAAAIGTAAVVGAAVVYKYGNKKLSEVMHKDAVKKAEALTKEWRYHTIAANEGWKAFDHYRMKEGATARVQSLLDSATRLNYNAVNTRKEANDLKDFAERAIRGKATNAEKIDYLKKAFKGELKRMSPEQLHDIGINTVGRDKDHKAMLDIQHILNEISGYSDIETNELYQLFLKRGH